MKRQKVYHFYQQNMIYFSQLTVDLIIHPEKEGGQLPM